MHCIYTYGRFVNKKEIKLHGILHNINKPAVTIYNKKNQILQEEWWENGKLHRINNPAIIRYLKIDPHVEHIVCKNLHKELHKNHTYVIYQEWRLHGELHRINGPAIINCDKCHEILLWYLYGKQYTYCQYKNICIKNLLNYKILPELSNIVCELI